MDIWEILEIEPTSDVAEIKKAYAGKVKYCHKEDNLDEWMKLHNAYMIAINSVKQNSASELLYSGSSKVKKDVYSDICNVEQEKVEDDNIKEDIEKTELNKENSLEDKIKNLYADIESGYVDYSTEKHPHRINNNFTNKRKITLRKIINNRPFMITFLFFFIFNIFLYFPIELLIPILFIIFIVFLIIKFIKHN